MAEIIWTAPALSDLNALAHYLISSLESTQDENIDNAWA